MSIAEFLDPQYVKSKLDNLDISLSTLRDAIRGTGNKTLTDLDTDITSFSGKFPSAAALGDALANPTTTIVGSALLGFDGTNWRRIAADSSSRLRTVVESVANPSNLDVALSTRSSEATLSAFSGKFPSAAALADNLSNPTTTIIGAANLGWDGTYWRRLATDTSSRLRTVVESVANPPNLDVALSTRSSESTLSSFSGKFPSAVALGDTLSNPTTTIIGAANLAFDGTNWRRIAADTSGRMKVALDSIPNPPNLDVALSTRLSESTFTARVPTLNTTSLDVGGASYNALVVIPSMGGDISRMPYMVENISVSTTEASTAIAAPGGKVLKIVNKGDVDVIIGINASAPTTNPLKIRARTAKIFVFKSVTAIYYKTATGTSTIDLEWWS